MMDTEAFREFKTGLTLLRDNYAIKALPHMRRAVDLDKNNPYYMSYLGVVLARSEGKWGEAERLCDSAVRMKRNQAQLYLNLAEVYSTAGRRDDAVDALQTGLKFARRDIRLPIPMTTLNPLAHPPRVTRAPWKQDRVNTAWLRTAACPPHNQVRWTEKKRRSAKH